MSYGDETDGAYSERVREARQASRPGDSLGPRQKRLWEVAEGLDNRLDGLAAALGPVLLPEGPTAALAGVRGDADGPAVSELGGFLDQLLQKLVRLADHADELTRRIDL